MPVDSFGKLRLLYIHMTTPREKEHFLHKLVVSSAFVCALCILPVAQYVLVSSENVGTTPEQGVVAGVSTDADIIPSPTPEVACAAKTSQIASLDSWLTNYQAGITTDYNNEVEVYRTTLAQNPSMDQADKDALNKLITDDYAPYSKRLEAAASAVESQKEVLASASCLTE